MKTIVIYCFLLDILKIQKVEDKRIRETPSVIAGVVHGLASKLISIDHIVLSLWISYHINQLSTHDDMIHETTVYCRSS